MRRSNRYSRGQSQPKNQNLFQSMTGFNPFIMQQKVQAIFKDLLCKMLNDFATSMTQHQLAVQVANFKVEQFIKSAHEMMQSQLQKFSCFIEDNFNSKEYIKNAKEMLDIMKQKRKKKLKTIMLLIVKLTNQIRNTRIEELQRILQIQLEKYKLKDIGNTIQYDKTRSIQEKYQKEYDQHFQKVVEQHDKICGRFEEKYCRKYGL